MENETSGSPTTDHGGTSPSDVNKKKQLQRHIFIKILSQNVQGFSSKYSLWKKDSTVAFMQEHNTDIYYVQQTQGHDDQPVTIYDHFFLLHSISIKDGYAKVGISITLSHNTQKAWK